jgi:hypothetical protein
MCKISAFAVLLAAQAAFGGSIHPQGSFFGNASAYASGAPLGPPQNCSYSSALGSNDTCSLTSIGSWTINGVGGGGTQHDAYASSWADSAGLHAIASADVSGEPWNLGYCGHICPVGSSGASAQAEWQDTLHPIAPAGWSGGPFFVQYSFSFDGSYSFNTLAPPAPGGLAAPSVTVTLSGASFQSWTYAPTLVNGRYPALGSVAIDTTLTDTFEVVNLNPIPYTLSLQVNVGVNCGGSGTSWSGICDAGAQADFSHTLTFSGISFQDSNGNPIPGFGLTSNSGSDYSSLITSNTAAAPEPAPALLVVLGLALAAVGIWKRWRDRPPERPST